MVTLSCSNVFTVFILIVVVKTVAFTILIEFFIVGDKVEFFPSQFSRKIKVDGNTVLWTRLKKEAIVKIHLYLTLVF